MAQYKAKVKCFIENALRYEGDVFEYNGTYNHHLEFVSGSNTADAEIQNGSEILRSKPKGKRNAADTSAA